MKIKNKEWVKIKETEFVGKSLRLFLSYSDKDKILAGKIKNILEQIQIRVFLAHEDIAPTEDWEEVILHNLNNCDMFLPLLTQNFVKSDWASQEIGIAYSNHKLILPLKVDIDPFGFIAKKQALKINEEYIEFSCKEIIQTISRDRILKENLKECIIQSLEKVYDFDSGEKRLEFLENFDFNEVQITEIFRIAIVNNQIRMSRKGTVQLKKWLSDYSDKINPFVKELFEKVQNEFLITISDD